MFRPLSLLAPFLGIAVVLFAGLTGAQSAGDNSHFTPVQRRVRPVQKPQVGRVPNPDPNGSTVARRYPQPYGAPLVTDACFIATNPPQGCMYTPYVDYPGNACGCVDVAGNEYQGEFLLY
jgi:hypothetical protein